MRALLRNTRHSGSKMSCSKTRTRAPFSTLPACEVPSQCWPLCPQAKSRKQGTGAEGESRGVWRARLGSTRTREEDGLLGDQRNRLGPLPAREAAHAAAPQQDVPGAGLVEARHQGGHRGLARARVAHQRGHLPPRDAQAHVAQHCAHGSSTAHDHGQDTEMPIRAAALPFKMLKPASCSTAHPTAIPLHACKRCAFGCDEEKRGMRSIGHCRINTTSTGMHYCLGVQRTGLLLQASHLPSWAAWGRRS